MALLDTLIGWVVVGAILTLLVATGVGVMSTSPPEFWAAKACFTLAAALLLLRMGLWIASEHASITARLILAFVLFGATGALWTGAWRWVSVREEQWTQPSPLASARPVTPAPVLAPKLRLGTTLEPDNEAQVFRLSVWNDGNALGIAEAQIVELVGGEQPHETELPIVLGWKQGKQHLSPRDQGKIEVVRVDRKRNVLLIGPGGFRHLTIRSAKGNIIPVSGRIRITILGTTLVEERTFELIPDERSELLYRPGPVTQPAS